MAHRTGNLTELLPYLELTETPAIMHNRDGTFEVAVAVDVPPNLGNLEGILQSLHHLVQRGLPNNTRLRLVGEVRPLSKGKLTLYRERITAEEEGLRRLYDERLALLDADLAAGKIRSHSTTLCVRLGTPKKNFYGLTRLQKRARSTIARQVLDTLVQVLTRAQFSPRALDQHELFALAFRYLNPDLAQSSVKFHACHKFYPDKAVPKIEGLNPSTLCAQLAKTPIHNSNPRHLLVGGKYVGMFALHTEPGRESRAGMIHAVEEAGNHYTLVLDVHIENAQKVFRRIKGRARQLESAATHEGFHVDSDTRKLQRDSDEALDHMSDTGDRFVAMSCGLVLFDESLHTLQSRITETYSALAAIPGNPFMALAHGLLAPFINFAPLGGRDHNQKVTMTASNAVHFFPLAGPWYGSEKPVALYRNRYYSLTKLDPFDKGVSAYNGLAIGSTGEGKTFFMQHFLSEFLADCDNQVIIIDRGGSYAPLVNAVGGALVNLTVGGATSINPFDLAPGQTTPTDEDKMQVLNLLRTMIPSEAGSLKDVEDAILTAAITQVYSFAYRGIGQQSRFETPTLSMFVQKLYSLDEVNDFHLEPEHRATARNLALRLKQWTGDTSLASFVDRQTNVPLSTARVVCYDTEGLRASPQLQSVGTFLMSQFAWRRVLARNGQNTLVIVDEADVILKDNRAGKPFMEETFARFRKTGSGIWVISQTLEHFRDMPTIGNNIHHLLLFKSNADERKRLQAYFNLPQHLVDLATQVTNSKGHYSEALCLVKKGGVFQGNIIALHPTQLDYRTFTTDNQDKARREEMLGKNGTLQQAVKQLEAA